MGHMRAEAVRRLVTLRHSSSARKVALGLWIVWAIIVWNVVFDYVIVVAGRNYIHAAGLAALGHGAEGKPAFVRMDDWMRPAVARGLWIASAAAGGIFLTGVVAVRQTR
jgi:hypothetical protein